MCIRLEILCDNIDIVGIMAHHFSTGFAEGTFKFKGAIYMENNKRNALAKVRMQIDCELLVPFSDEESPLMSCRLALSPH